MIGSGAVVIDRIAAGFWGQSCYVVSGERGEAVVVDPGGEAERIVERVAAKRLNVHAVLATHGHHDHVGAVAEVAETHGALFGIHSADARALSRVNFCRSVFHGLERVEIPPIDIDLAETARLRFGGLEIAVVHTPGHTPGSVCLEVGGMLLTGDTLIATESGNARMPEGDADAWRTSLRRLAAAYSAETQIYPGHGAPGVLGDAISRLRESPE